MYCTVCSSLLDITKTVVKRNINFDQQPDTVTDENDDKIQQMIDQIIRGDQVKSMQNFKIDQIMNHIGYLQLDKTKKALVTGKLELLANTADDISSMYYDCKTCKNYYAIENNTLVASKIGATTQTVYINKDKFKNYIYNRALPITRNYICPNNKCIGNTEPAKHEAVMYRVDINSMAMMYTCIACQEVW